MVMSNNRQKAELKQKKKSKTMSAAEFHSLDTSPGTTSKPNDGREVALSQPQSKTMSAAEFHSLDTSPGTTSKPNDGGEVALSKPQSKTMSAAEYHEIVKPPTPNPKIGLPEVLLYLQPVNAIRINSRFNAFSFRASKNGNEYSICISSDSEFLSAVEKPGCSRFICAGGRPFTIHIKDTSNDQACFQLIRPYNLGGCKPMQIFSPPETMIGYVKSRFFSWKPSYDVYDGDNKHIFALIGAFSCCRCGQDLRFYIFDAEDLTQPIGHIIKEWQGMADAILNANNYAIKIPSETDIIKKTLLLGASFLLDFDYF